MTDYTYGGGSLPPSKENAEPLGDRTLLNFLLSDEWNDLLDSVASLKTALLAGNRHGLANIGTDALPSTPAGGGLLGARAARLLFKEDGMDGEDVITRPPEQRTLRYFGVVMDSTSDANLAKNNTALAAADDWVQTMLNASRPPSLIVPVGQLAYSEPWVLHGSQGGAPSLLGEAHAAPAFNLDFHKLVWYGDPDLEMLYLEQMNQMLVRGLSFMGRNIAGRHLRIAASEFGVLPGVLKASDALRIEKCRFQGVKIQTPGNACVAIGTPPSETPSGTDTWEAADVTFRECYFIAEDNGAPGFDYAGMEAAGVLMLAPGNCKNFEFHRCDWITCNVALDWTQSSGYCLVKGYGGADVRCMFKQSAGQLVAMGGDVEAGHVSDCKLFVGGTNGSTTQIIATEFFANCGPDETPIIECGGNLGLYYNTLCNQDDEGTKHTFRIILNALAGYSPTGAMAESVGNTFYGCGNLARPFGPFYDGGGNDLTGGSMAAYGRSANVALRSFGDFGQGAGFTSLGVGSTPVRLRPVNGTVPEFSNLMLYQNGFGFGHMATPPRYEGQVREGAHAYVIDFNDLKAQAAGASAVSITLFQGQGSLGYRLVDCFAQIETPFAGTTLTAKVNHLDDGDVTVMQDLDVTQAANTFLGCVDSERGDFFKPGDARYNSKGLHWAHVDAHGIYARFTGGANLTANLTAGKITFYVVVQAFKQGAPV